MKPILPHDYALCSEHQCPRAEECARYQAFMQNIFDMDFGLEVAARRRLVTFVLPNITPCEEYLPM